MSGLSGMVDLSDHHIQYLKKYKDSYLEDVDYLEDEETEPAMRLLKFGLIEEAIDLDSFISGEFIVLGYRITAKGLLFLEKQKFISEHPQL